MRVYLTRAATRQVDEILVYLAAENPSAAQRFVARMEEIRQLFLSHPEIGRKIPHRRLRRFPLHPFPYLVYYEVRGRAVRIVRVWHSARRHAAFHDLAQAFVFQRCSDDERRGMERGSVDACPRKL
jgi:plasmid stabilization system protein ParE